MDIESYRKLQEAWVSGNSGTSLIEVYYLTNPLQLGVLISCLRTQLPSFANDFFFIVLPILAAVTDPWNDTRIIPGLMLAAVIFGVLFDNSRSFKHFWQIPPELYPSWLTNFRACTYIATSVCILAVDFTIFPRRFAKTETYGYGFMDLGVGMFVVCNGFVYKRESYKGVLVLLALGLVRLATTKSVDYHQHVSEYGIHWNFFFTLALCRFLGGLVRQLFGSSILMSILLCIAHQASLSSGLEHWVLSTAPRNDFLSANKEGISSILGYTALFYSSAAVCQFLLRSSTRRYMALKLLCICIITWVLTVGFSQTHGVSRRLCNLGYITWILAMSTTTILKFVLIDWYMYVRDKSRVPYLLEAINRNGLFYFMLANILTGMVNLNVQTLLLSKWQSYAVLIVYCYILNYSTFVMNRRQIRMKFW